MEKMSLRLEEDHKNAQILAKGLAEEPLIDLKPEDVHTNIVVFKLKYALSFRTHTMVLAL